MNKIKIIALVTMLCFLFTTTAFAANWDAEPKNYDVKVFIDDKDSELTFPAGMGKPFIAKDRTFVPYRVMCEALGASVDWDNDTRKVTAAGNNNTVELFIGNPNYKVNGEARTMDVEPFILTAESRTYIPARYITEGLNYTIDFARGGKVMYIVSFTKGQTEAERKAVLQELVNLEKPQTGQWGSKYNKLSPEKAAELKAMPISKISDLPMGDPGVNTFNCATDGYNEILERMPLQSNQAFYSDKNVMYVNPGGMITIRGVLQTQNSDSSVKEQIVDVSAFYGATGWGKVVFHDLATDEIWT
jgi:hypothetical protein